MFKHQMGRKLLAVALLVGIGFFATGFTPAAARQGSSFITHRVSRGQNLWVIAQRYDVSVRNLTEWNQMDNPNMLYEGQTLIIPKRQAQDSAAHTLDAADCSFSNQDMELLARLIYAEARGENFQGQVAVGAVVLNRLRDPQFPKSVHGVIYQPGAFTAIQDRQFWLQPDDTAWTAAEAAVSGMDPTGGALFYYNPSIARDRWIKTRPVLKVIGNHTFAS